MTVRPPAWTPDQGGLFSGRLSGPSEAAGGGIFFDNRFFGLYDSLPAFIEEPPAGPPSDPEVISEAGRQPGSGQIVLMAN
jgi:hypothetical protein